MKKKIEAELISIAHRILKMKNKSDVVALHQETQKLYEKLSVLRFVEEKFGDAKPTIGNAEIESKLEEFYDDEPVLESDNDENTADSEAVAIDETDTASEAESETTSNDEEVQADSDAAAIDETDTAPEAEPEVEPVPKDEPEVEDVPKETPEIPAIDPDENKEEIPEEPNAEADQNDSEQAEISDEPEDVPPTPEQPETKEELEVAENSENVIETKDDSTEESSDKRELFIPAFELAFDPKTDDAVEVAKDPAPQFSFDDLLGKDYADPVFVKPHENESSNSKSASNDYFTPPKEAENKSVSLNDRLSKGITIGLNDRIAFMKHLFGDSSEDYNRVLSQLMTFDSFDEAKNFIDDMVKPDYNNWEGKDEYSQRFMEIVEKRFT